MPSKPPSAEGFEKCLIDNINAHQSSHGAGSSSNKQTARIVYPPSQEELSGGGRGGDRDRERDRERDHDHHHHSTHPHHSQSVKVKSESEGTRRLKGEPNEAGDAKMGQFIQAPFHGLIPGQGIVSSAEGERFMMEQRKRFEQMALAAAAAAGAGGNSAAEKQAAGDRFRSVEAMMANHNAAANSPSLKFAREPFSSEHFERELRQMDFSGRVLAEHEELLKGGRLSSHSSFGGSGQPMINPMKPSAVSVSLEQMDEASKLFSASFQKDSAHQRNDSAGSGQMTALTSLMPSSQGKSTPTRVGRPRAMHRPVQRRPLRWHQAQQQRPLRCRLKRSPAAVDHWATLVSVDSEVDLREVVVVVVVSHHWHHQ